MQILPFQTADGKDLAYAQIVEEDGHKSLHAIISIGEMGEDKKIALVITNCGEGCHYMLMPQ